jgi:hypothetical protein
MRQSFGLFCQITTYISDSPISQFFNNKTGFGRYTSKPVFHYENQFRANPDLTGFVNLSGLKKANTGFVLQIQIC